MTRVYSAGFHHDGALDQPIGTTTPAMRAAARRVCARRADDDLGDVLQALGLAPYTREETA